MGALQLGLGALASFAVGLFGKDSIVPMVLIMTSTTLLCIF
jgi:DHA1 family bicyclomycin/chloramphenicol resistance-like MFS transporter